MGEPMLVPSPFGVWPLSGHIKPSKYVRFKLKDPDLVVEWDISNI
jgi:hypothetical protein